MTDLHLVERARGLHAAGLSTRAIAATMNVSHTTIQRWLTDQPSPPPRVIPPLHRLPPRETLTSQRGDDGRWHAHYPTATRTLCGRDVQPSSPGRRYPPDCGVCAKTARRFHAIEPCQPMHWLPEFEMDAA